MANFWQSCFASEDGDSAWLICSSFATTTTLQICHDKIISSKNQTCCKHIPTKTTLAELAEELSRTNDIVISHMRRTANVRTKIPKPSYDSRNECRTLPLTPDDPPFSASEIDAAIKNLHSQKAPGPDGLYGDIIKEAYAINPILFRDLYNKCLRMGHFPRRWKSAQVVLFNKQNKTDDDPSAYRPICLLDALGKVLDKLVTQWLFHHLLSNNLLNINQFGFTPGKSATDAILEIKNWIAEARAEGQHSIVISLDVQSAFSRVRWPKVLHTLKDLECPANIFKLVSSFLDDRQAFINYDGCSLRKNYSVGCPQGSNSGPLYWLLIANEVLNIQFEEDVRLLAYADDFCLFIKATCKHIIQEHATIALEQLDL
ncbi:Retrovirus-related Pol polyprotein from type-1 retrotransposable element R1 [Araneus ventricosus]|uniref:Retrovirus-related Pol polyprotein from type-1 retrotransposable element R1 n=1 Tax=Araneus ventricosus TaxID=182803 RepID=A0A4Y2RD69_ARAVE|nr:Retrovirus-related Pol polyprotein from type-1 retrotransposable element R1 [Araneus ventricosus]